MHADLRVDRELLLQRIEELGRHGARDDGGVCRLALSAEDVAARQQVRDWCAGLGVSERIDRVGNQIFVRPGTDPEARPVLTGSHLDSVVSGGKLDGPYGVLAGLAVLEALERSGVQTRRPVGVCTFTNEEGVRFTPDMMGSLVYAGGMSVEEVLDRQDPDGIAVGTALEQAGYAGDLEPGAIVPAAFVELHIEQGPLLEADGIDIGAVAELQGISWTKVVVQGQANHAGTTPMHLRRDAGQAAAEVIARLSEIVAAIGGSQVATCGKVELSPGVINVIARRAEFTVDLRNTDEAKLQRAEAMLDDLLADAAAQQRVEVRSERLSRFAPVTFDPGIVERIEAVAARLGHSCRRMTSGAGHDAQMMARIAPTAMVFVPSRGGVSHSPREFTEPDQLVAGADVLLHTMLELAVG